MKSLDGELRGGNCGGRFSNEKSVTPGGTLNCGSNDSCCFVDLECDCRQDIHDESMCDMSYLWQMQQAAEISYIAYAFVEAGAGGVGVDV